MAKFLDKDGRDWSVALTVGHLPVAKEAGIDLAGMIRDEKRLGELFFQDPENLVRLAWVLCHEQAEADGITPEEFAYRFDGPTLERAGEALAEAVLDFFPRSKVASALKGHLRTALERMDESLLKSISTASAGRSPDSSGSIPTP